MVRLKTIAALFLIAGSAFAHQEADVRMLFDVPQFVPIGQAFRYRVVADDLTNDEGADVTVTIVLPLSVQFAGMVPNETWTCTETNRTITCRADEIASGPNPIDVNVIAPLQPGPLHATASVVSTGSLDLNPKNDNAASEIFVFDPSVCVAAPPQIVSPADGANAPAVVALTWGAVAGARSYTIYTAVEGAAAAAALTVATTAASLVAEPGTSEWWVVASFDNCPPAESVHRHFTAAVTIERPVRTLASGFSAPFGVALSPEGDLYVSDEADNVIRKITNGTVTTVAGIPGRAGSADGQFAQFNAPRGLAVTPFDGFIYAADALNNAVRILYTGGPFVPAYNVSGDAGFRAPSGIAATDRGTLYVADTANNAIRKLTPVPDFIGLFNVTTVASNLHAPLGVAVDANGKVFIADTDDGSVRTLDGNVIARGFDHPAGIALDGLGNVFLTDRRGVFRIAPSGMVTTVATGFASLAGIVVDGSGRIFVADSAAHVVDVIDRPTQRARAVR